MSDHNEAQLRAEVRQWLEAHWDPDRPLVEWRNLLADAGWGVPHWPREWHGMGLPVPLSQAIDEEFAAFGAVGVAKAGIRMLAAAHVAGTRRRLPQGAFPAPHPHWRGHLVPALQRTR